MHICGWRIVEGVLYMTGQNDRMPPHSQSVQGRRLKRNSINEGLIYFNEDDWEGNDDICDRILVIDETA